MADDRAATLATFREKYPMYGDMSDDQLGSKLAEKYPDDYGYLAKAPASTTTDRLELKGNFPGDMPWADAVRRYSTSPQRAALPPIMRILGDFAAAVVPTTGAQTGAMAALAPLGLIPGVGPLAAAAIRTGAAGAGAALGETLTGGQNPGAEALRHAIPTALTEGGLKFAEKFVLPPLQNMWRFGTLRPFEAGRLARAEERAGRSAAEATASAQTRALETAAKDDAARRTTEARASAQATRDVAERMRTGTRRSQIAHDMGAIVPELETQGDELYGMAFQWGKPRLDALFAEQMAEITPRIAHHRFTIPGLGQSMTFDEARTALAELGTSIGQQGRTVRSAQQAYSAVDYRKARDELQRQLNVADAMQAMPPGSRPLPAGDLWDEAMKHRAAGRAYLAVLQKAIDPKSGLMDPDKLFTLVNKNVEKLRERFGPAWDRAELALLGGQRTPAQVTGPLKTPPVAKITPEPVIPVAPVYPPTRQPFRFSPGAVLGADLAAQDPYVGAGEMALAGGIPSQLWRWAHRLVP